MINPARQKPFSKLILVVIVVAVAGLGILLAVLATVGDDVPNRIPPASQSSPGE
ncbi:MAG TPA: hypothetical protein VIT23_15380 [Terrimicrobiaceae bacterium]